MDEEENEATRRFGEGGCATSFLAGSEGSAPRFSASTRSGRDESGTHQPSSLVRRPAVMRRGWKLGGVVLWLAAECSSWRRELGANVAEGAAGADDAAAERADD